MNTRKIIFLSFFCSSFFVTNFADDLINLSLLEEEILSTIPSLTPEEQEALILSDTDLQELQILIQVLTTIETHDPSTGVTTLVQNINELKNQFTNYNAETITKTIDGLPKLCLSPMILIEEVKDLKSTLATLLEENVQTVAQIEKTITILQGELKETYQKDKVKTEQLNQIINLIAACKAYLERQTNQQTGK